MGIINTGFGRRRREANDKLPPGQYLTSDFPVLSAGPTPAIPTGSRRSSSTSRSSPGHAGAMTSYPRAS